MNGGGTTPVAKIVVLARPAGPLHAQMTSAPLASASACTQPEAAMATVHVAAVSTAYEAAAEILAGPTAALVVDLPLLTEPHVRLLSLAADFGVPAYGVGPLRPGLNCGVLHHLRQVCADDLGELLRTACREFENSMRWAEAAGEAPESVLEAALAEPPPVEAASPPLSSDAPATAGLQPLVGEYVPASPPPPTPNLNPFLAGAAAAAQDEEELADSQARQGQYIAQPAPQPSAAATQSEKSQPGMPKPPAAPQPPAGDATNLLTSEELSALLKEEP